MFSTAKMDCMIPGGTDLSCLAGGLQLRILKLTCEAHVQSGVGLGIWRIYWVGETIQEL